LLRQNDYNVKSRLSQAVIIGDRRMGDVWCETSISNYYSTRNLILIMLLGTTDARLCCVKSNFLTTPYLRKQAVRVATQYASAPASWQYFRIYSPGGTCSGMLAI